MTLSELKQLIIKLERIPGYEDGYIVLNEGSQTISIHKDNCENCPKIGKICAYTSISENMRNFDHVKEWERSIPSPDILVGALQDRVHTETGKCWPSKSIKILNGKINK